MLAILRQRDFAFLWTAAALSMLGTWVRFAALFDTLAGVLAIALLRPTVGRSRRPEPSVIQAEVVVGG